MMTNDELVRICCRRCEVKLDKGMSDVVSVDVFGRRIQGSRIPEVDVEG